ncbi:hypothetical protein Pmani_014401 [Petrolisthes manimaculis]|uniref:Uncharacterized protein n=1 Tax=Petrolisthes manimaculis TaxID=1843537 RepID=A0AAE1PW59_9EUCA|nr:hypothetical protein Pmani_014401 [Petrolisthes manimaculis]
MDLAENRDAVVTVLNLIDNIAATQTSLNNLTVNNIATTAKASNIDKDWQKLLSNNKVTRDWWDSDKPRRLQNHNTGTVNTGTQVHSPLAQHTPTLTLTSNLQTPPLNTVTQVQSPDTQLTPTPKLTPNLQASALNTVTQVQSPDNQSTPTQTLTPNLQASALNTVTQVQSPVTQSTPTQTLTPNLQASALNKGPQAQSLTSNIQSPSRNSPSNIKKNTTTNTHTSLTQSLPTTHPKSSNNILTNTVGCQTQSPTNTEISTRPKITQNQKQDKHKSHQANPGQPSAAAKGNNPPRPTNTQSRKTYHYTKI